MSDIFCFRLSNADLDDIERELFQGDKRMWRNILTAYGERSDDDKHAFLYLHITDQRIFVNWDEVITR
jgi:hypothetical protein